MVLGETKTTSNAMEFAMAKMMVEIPNRVEGGLDGQWLSSVNTQVGGRRWRFQMGECSALRYVWFPSLSLLSSLFSFVFV